MLPINFLTHDKISTCKSAVLSIKIQLCVILKWYIYIIWNKSEIILNETIFEFVMVVILKNMFSYKC